jgi:DNA-binding response OmpR family regulator
MSVKAVLAKEREIMIDAPFGLILVAEDDPLMAAVIRYNLERVGYAVDVAQDGVQAWQSLNRESYDCAIVDYQLPGMDGEQLCRLLRGKLKNDVLPVLVVSGRVLGPRADKLKDELSISAIVEKPFSPRSLVATVQDSIMTSHDQASSDSDHLRIKAPKWGIRARSANASFDSAASESQGDRKSDRFDRFSTVQWQFPPRTNPKLKVAVC